MIACSSSVSITSMLYVYIQVLLFLSSLSKTTSHNHQQLLKAFLSVIRVHLVWYTLATSLTIAVQLLVYVHVCAYTRFACSVHVLYLTLYLSIFCVVYSCGNHSHQYVFSGTASCTRLTTDLLNPISSRCLAPLHKKIKDTYVTLKISLHAVWLWSAHNPQSSQSFSLQDCSSPQVTLLTFA